jgi:membrane-bound serine protease (ClpP class)
VTGPGFSAYKKVVSHVREASLFYLKNVLGLDRVVWPLADVGEEPSSSSLPPVLGEGCRIAFVGSCGSDQESELFGKILGAMKLDLSQVSFFQISEDFRDFEKLKNHIHQMGCEEIVWLGENSPFSKAKEIPNLAQMLKSPEKKKSAWKVLQGLLIFLLFFTLTASHGAEPKKEVLSTLKEKPRVPAHCIIQMDLTSVVGPATLDLLNRSFLKAQNQNCGALLLRVNTPGGNLQTTRLIVEKIVNSPIPVMCLVAPAGGHAGSAGAIILQACHLNGALEATNIGAATPVTLGEELGKDMRNKIVSDTVSMLDGLTELRGRNKQFGRDIVEKATSVDAAEAKKIGAIDFLGVRQEEFLQFADQKTVKLNEGRTAVISPGEVHLFPQDLRFNFLDLVTHPQVAYLIFMGSLALLYFEITHTGMIAPGVIGTLGLITSLISFHMLDVRWGGLALLLLGLGLMIAEIFVTSFGALGVGGLVAFISGSLLLYDPTVAVLPLATILPAALGLSSAMMLVGWLALRAQRMRVVNKGMVGETGIVTRLSDETLRSGQLECKGEIWSFESARAVSVGDPVTVQEMKGLVLIVNKKTT